MNVMEPLSTELKDNQYYVSLLDELITENDLELKHRLQKADIYGRFVNEQAAMLMDDTIAYRSSNGVSFPLASSAILESWKEKMFK